MSSDSGAQVIVQKLHDIRKVRLLTDGIISDLSPINQISFQAGMLITNLDGAYKPGISARKEFGI